MAQPIAADLIEMDAGSAKLFGGRHRETGKFVFPMPVGPEGSKYERVPLKSEGTLWSFTVQRFRPKSPPYAGADDDRSFKPFALGYVELPGQIIVETRIDTDDFSKLRIGMPMKLVASPFARASGDAPITYAFRPAA
ncbi:MAG TPA: OB-fold domain-containing protein [Rhizomicrobium sp.]|nr:OB-fold domain-containing protein [Rhizomicrobium sp.]